MHKDNGGNEMRFFSICSHPVKGNSYLVQSQNTQILIDAGFTKTLLHQSLYHYEIETKDIKGILLTHSHQPHVKGIRFLLEQDSSIPVYASKETFEEMDFKKIENKIILEERKEIQIGNMTIYPFPVKHFVSTLNFVVETNGERLACVTNTGNIEKKLIDDIGKCQHFLIEAYYHPGLMRKVLSWEEMKHIVTTEGHLTNEDATEIVGRCFNPKLKNVVICNVSKYNRPFMSKLLMESIFGEHDEVHVELAPPDYPSRWFGENLEYRLWEIIKKLSKEKQRELIQNLTKA